MLWVYGHNKYVYSYSAGIDFSRQNLTFTDVRFCPLINMIKVALRVVRFKGFWNFGLSRNTNNTLYVRQCIQMWSQTMPCYMHLMLISRSNFDRGGTKMYARNGVNGLLVSVCVATVYTEKKHWRRDWNRSSWGVLEKCKSIFGWGEPVYTCKTPRRLVFSLARTSTFLVLNCPQATWLWCHVALTATLIGYRYKDY